MINNTISNSNRSNLPLINVTITIPYVSKHVKAYFLYYDENNNLIQISADSEGAPAKQVTLDVPINTIFYCLYANLATGGYPIVVNDSKGYDILVRYANGDNYVDNKIGSYSNGSYYYGIVAHK